MPGMYANDEKCQRFARNLKALRESRGWSQEKLAAEAKVSKGIVANTESFQRPPLEDHGIAYDVAFGLDDVFAKAAREIQGDSFPVAFQDFPAHEATAHDLYAYQHSLFPGLIQTERYMRAVFATLPNPTPEEIERLAAGRLKRQEVLYRTAPQPPRLWALVDEAALRRPIGDPDVMYEQCMRALEVSRLPLVSLGVVPYSAGGHSGLLGSCTIVERDGVPRIVNIEDFVDGRVSEDPTLIKRAALRFRSLQQEALPKAATQNVIARIAEEIWNGTAPTGARALTAVTTAETV